MEYHRTITPSTADVPKGAWHALSACGLWMRVGFVGASTLAAGLVLAFRGESGALTTLALILGGGLVAVLSWRYARTILERADAWDAGTSGAARVAREPAAGPRSTLRRPAILGIE